LVLHKRFELLELLEDMSFGLREENPRIPREVINESDILHKSTQRYRRHRTTYIRMNQINNTCYFVVIAWKISLGVLPHSTTLTHLLVLCTEI
jgi:hypothetical protein